MTSLDSTQPDQPFDDYEDVPYLDAEQGTHRDVGEYLGELIAAQTRARRANTVTLMVISLLVVGTVTLCAVIALRAQTNAERSSQRVGNLVTEAIKLRDTVSSLQGRLDANQGTTDAVAVCTAKIAVTVRDTTRDYTASLGDLIIALRPAAEGSPNQGAVIDKAIASLSTKLDAYRKATDLYSKWTVLAADAKAKLPCPVP